MGSANCYIDRWTIHYIKILNVMLNMTKTNSKLFKKLELVYCCLNNYLNYSLLCFCCLFNQLFIYSHQSWFDFILSCSHLYPFFWPFFFWLPNWSLEKVWSLEAVPNWNSCLYAAVLQTRRHLSLLAKSRHSWSQSLRELLPVSGSPKPCLCRFPWKHCWILVAF